MEPSNVVQTFSLRDRVYRTEFPDDGAYTVVGTRSTDTGAIFHIQCVCSPHTDSHIEHIWVRAMEIKHV